MSRRIPARSASRRILAPLGALLLLAALAGQWASPAYVALGQTIPWPTDTPPRPASATPHSTRTWTPQSTWTLSPTQAPAQPTPTARTLPPTAQATAGPGESATTAPSATCTATPPAPTRTLPLPSPATPLASPSPSARPVPLVLRVVAEPPLAGPGDEVRFIVQVANVGREPVSEASLEAALPGKLLLRSWECSRGTATERPGGLAIAIGQLGSGEQVVAFVTTTVAEDAWPGQTLRATWQTLASGLAPQQAITDIELPWAELPATGPAGCRG